MKDAGCSSVTYEQEAVLYIQALFTKIDHRSVGVKLAHDLPQEPFCK